MFRLQFSGWLIHDPSMHNSAYERISIWFNYKMVSMR
jgi:hypothetical protein